jgi:hypothetical protein
MRYLLFFCACLAFGQITQSSGGGGVAVPAAGVVKSNGTALQTATAGTDYLTTGTLPVASTTIGAVKSAACAAGNHATGAFAGDGTPSCSADSGGGGTAALNAPYLQIGGVNYIPMMNMAPATLWVNSGYAVQSTITQANATPTITSTGAGAAAPIVNNPNGTPSNWMHSIGAHTKLKVMYAEMAAGPSSGFGVIIGSGGISAVWCSVYGMPNDGVEVIGTACRRVGSGYDITTRVFTGANPQHVALAIDLSVANTGNFQISFDGGTTWNTFYSVDYSGGGLGYTPTIWGLYNDPGASAQVLSYVEQ